MVTCSRKSLVNVLIQNNTACMVQNLSTITNNLCLSSTFLFNRADLDPIYFCELIRQCPIFDQGDAKIKDLSVSPKVGPQGM